MVWRVNIWLYNMEQWLDPLRQTETPISLQFSCRNVSERSGKAHMRPTSSLVSFPTVAFEKRSSGGGSRSGVLRTQKFRPSWWEPRVIKGSLFFSLELELYALPAARASSLLISAFLVHSGSFFYFFPKPQNKARKEAGHF